MNLKIRTDWGDATIDISKIKYYNCHVDTWKQTYCIVITYSGDNTGNDQVTALCDNFDDMIRTCKKIHDKLIYQF